MGRAACRASTGVFNNLVERAIHEEDLTRATTEAELAHIASRAREANLAEEAGGSGFAGEDSREYEDLSLEALAGENEAAGEPSGAAAGNPSVEGTIEEEEEEEEEPAALRHTKR